MYLCNSMYNMKKKLKIELVYRKKRSIYTVFYSFDINIRIIKSEFALLFCFLILRKCVPVLLKLFDPPSHQKWQFE